MRKAVTLFAVAMTALAVQPVRAESTRVFTPTTSGCAGVRVVQYRPAELGAAFEAIDALVACDTQLPPGDSAHTETADAMGGGRAHAQASGGNPLLARVASSAALVEGDIALEGPATSVDLTITYEIVRLESSPLVDGAILDHAVASFQALPIFSCSGGHGGISSNGNGGISSENGTPVMPSTQTFSTTITCGNGETIVDSVGFFGYTFAAVVSGSGIGGPVTADGSVNVIEVTAAITYA